MPRLYKPYDFSDYIVTKDGEIFSKRKNRLLKPQPNGKGYLRISIGGKLYFVHRLVAEQYVSNPENKPQVNHKDGNKLNNAADNLEWVTNLENRKHAVKNGLHLCGDKCSWSKLSREKVLFILSHPEIPNQELASVFGVTISTIKAVRNNKSWKNEKIC